MDKDPNADPEIDDASQVAHLREAVASRQVIGQAIGLLMSEHQLNEDAALEILRRRSSHSNVKVRDVARQMVEHANSAGRGLRPTADC